MTPMAIAATSAVRWPWTSIQRPENGVIAAPARYTANSHPSAAVLNPNGASAR